MFHPQGPSFWELAQQALTSTRRGYDLLAPKFDYTPFRTPDVLLQAVAPWLGPLDSVETALDVCCGTGAAMHILRPRCRRQVVGIDFSRNMIETGRRQLEAAPGHARCEFVHADVLEMPFDSAFDLAVCFGALGHIRPPDQPRFVAEVARVLKPGGRFVFASSELPPRTSRRYWLSRGFNAAMRLRNLVVRPPFIMFYLTFLIPLATRLLEQAGFKVEIHDNIFPPPFQRACLVIATRI